MRLCSGRVPQAGRKWRLIECLTEDGVLVAEEVVVAEVDPLTLSLEVQTESEEEEDLEFMDETVSWLESGEESSESEQEEELDWEGLIET